MGTLHLLLGWLNVAAALLVVVAAVAGLVAAQRMWLWLDRAILVCALVLVIGALSGLPILLGDAPRDPLHLLYGVLAPAVLLGGRYLGRGPDMRRRSAVMLVTGLAVAGVTMRLFTTA